MLGRFSRIEGGNQSVICTPKFVGVELELFVVAGNGIDSKFGLQFLLRLRDEGSWGENLEGLNLASCQVLT